MTSAGLRQSLQKMHQRLPPASVASVTTTVITPALMAACVDSGHDTALRTVRARWEKSRCEQELSRRDRELRTARCPVACSGTAAGGETDSEDGPAFTPRCGGDCYCPRKILLKPVMARTIRLENAMSRFFIRKNPSPMEDTDLSSMGDMKTQWGPARLRDAARRRTVSAGAQRYLATSRNSAISFLVWAFSFAPTVSWRQWSI